MEAKETSLSGLTNTNTQFVLPLYQRKYSWEERHIRRLWDDIIVTAQRSDVTDYFIGSVVFVSRDRFRPGSVARLLLIDGQQRITSLSLLLAALRDHAEENGDSSVSVQELNEYFLLNRFGKGADRYKLLLTGDDAVAYQAILDKTAAVSALPASPITQNYGLFRQWIAEAQHPLPLILQGVQKLIMVSIGLTRGRDNPQLIFESMNSTGMDLSQADLIRNFVLMGLEIEEQAALYEDYWLPMERTFAGAPDRINAFLRHYVALKTGRTPASNGVYDGFKAHFAKADAYVLRELEQLSRRYAALRYGAEADPALKAAFDGLAPFRADVVYPFLLKLYALYEEKALSKEALLEAVGAITSYLARRVVCELPTRTLPKTFAELSTEASAAGLRALKGSAAWPTDEVFAAAFVDCDLPRLRGGKVVAAALKDAGHPWSRRLKAEQRQAAAQKALALWPRT